MADELSELDVVNFVIELEDNDTQGRWPKHRRNADAPDAPERAKMHREPPFWEEDVARETDHQA